MKARLESIGTYLPPRELTMQDRLAKMKNPPAFDMEAITGIKAVRWADDAQDDGLSMAVKAAKDCLSRSKYKPEDLDVIISCSITRYSNGKERNIQFEPPLSHTIKYVLGAPQAMHFDVSNACAGMFTGVLILDRMIKAGTVKRGMVISGDFITPITETASAEIVGATDPQFGSMTVGDSGCALIVDGAESDADCINYFELMGCSEYSELCLAMPSVETEGLCLYTVNAEMHKKDRVQLWPNFQIDYYKKNGSSLADEKFDHIIHHQVGTRAIHNFSKYGAEFFGSPLPTSSLYTVDYLGNTATTAHFIVLSESLKKGKIKKGERVLIVPAASGVVTGFLSVNISNLGA